MQYIIDGKQENKNISDFLPMKKQEKWRQKQNWYKDGKQNECEIYQRNLMW